MSASGTRSTAATCRPPASTAATRRSTVASCTAASSTCMRGSPPSPGLAGPRIAKSSTASSSGIGMSSAAWNCSALASSSRDISGISIWRTTTRGLASPRRTGDLLQADLGAQPADGLGDRGVVGDLAFAHRLARERDLTEHVEARRVSRRAPLQRSPHWCRCRDRSGGGPCVASSSALGLEVALEVAGTDTEVLADANRGQRVRNGSGGTRSWSTPAWRRPLREP